MNIETNKLKSTDKGKRMVIKFPDGRVLEGILQGWDKKSLTVKLVDNKKQPIGFNLKVLPEWCVFTEERA